MGISETSWLGLELTPIHNKEIYFSGNNNPDHKNRVGIILNSDIGNTVPIFVALSDECMLVQLTARPVNVNLIQVYTPTAERPMNELEK